MLLRRRNIVLREKKVLCNLNVKTIIRIYFLGRRGLRYLRIAIVYGLYRIVVYINVCAEIELLKVKVPLICLCTKGVSARREGRYQTRLLVMSGKLINGHGSIFHK